MVKLIVSDFDGTLLAYGEKRVSQKVIRKIEDYLDKGISFAVASGRTYTELKTLLSDIADRIYFIADDGALTFKGDKILYKKPFDLNSIKFFFDPDIVKDAVMYSLDKAYIINSSKITTLGKTPKHIKRAFEVTDDIYKVSANMRDKSLISCDGFRVHYSDDNFAEFVSPYANKGIALSVLQLHLSVSKYDTVAIGDADNDVAMMFNSKFSISIGEKSKKLKEVSKFGASDILAAMEIIDNL